MARERINALLLDHSWLVFVVVFVGALTTRLVFVTLTVGFDTLPTDDAAQYDLLAQNLWSEGVYGFAPHEPTSLRMPLLPGVLAMTYAIFGHSYATARFMLCILNALVVIVVYLFARKRMDPATGLVAAGLVVIYPNTLYWSAELLTETPAMLLVMLSIFLMARVREQRNVGNIAGASLCLAALYLTKPEFLLMFGFVPLWAWGWQRDLRKTVILSIYLLAIPVFTMVFWAVRNYHVNDAFVLATTSSGTTFEGAHNNRVWKDEAYFGYWISCGNRPDCEIIIQEFTPERDDEAWSVGLRYVSDNLDKVPLLSLRKLLRLWIWPPTSWGIVGYPVYAILMPVSLLGFVMSWYDENRYDWLWPSCFLLVTTIVALVFYGSARFRAPIEPVVLIFFSSGAMGIYKRITHLVSHRENVLYGD